MTTATMRRFFLIPRLRLARRALQSLRPSSPEGQPDVSVLRGAHANLLVSECPHAEHSNARLSMPSVSSDTDIVVIRIWHLGQRGRWIGNNSGSGFRMAFALEQAGARHSLIHRCCLKSGGDSKSYFGLCNPVCRVPDDQSWLRQGQEFGVRHGRASSRPSTSFPASGLEDVDTRDKRGHDTSRVAMPCAGIVARMSTTKSGASSGLFRVAALMRATLASMLRPPRERSAGPNGPRAGTAPERRRFPCSSLNSTSDVLSSSCSTMVPTCPRASRCAGRSVNNTTAARTDGVSSLVLFVALIIAPNM
jgi:hypothetical protein